MSNLDNLLKESKILANRVFKNYSSKNYYFRGVVSHDSEFEYNNHFEGFISKDGQYKMEWFSDGRFKNGGIVFGSDSKGTLITRHYASKSGLTSERFREKDNEMAIAGATGISSGSAHLIRALQLGEYDSVFPERIDSLEKNDGLQTIDGWSQENAFRTKIDIRKNQIVKITTTIYPARMELESIDTRDEKIIADLKEHGKEVSQKEIDNLRAIYEDCNIRQEEYDYDDCNQSTTIIEEQYEMDSFELNEAFNLWK